jgi:hypothetical protein
MSRLGSFAFSSRAECSRPRFPFRGQRIVIGVPTGIIRARRTMSSFRNRMHPWETRPGRSSGRFVPWIPTKPPPGQSVTYGERTLVPNRRPEIARPRVRCGRASP